MATQDSSKQDLEEVLDNIGHPTCRACTDAALPSCLHNSHDVLLDRLRANLARWSTGPGQEKADEVQPIFYRLEEWRSPHHELNATYLQGADLAKLEAVQAIAAELQLNVYLARLQRTERGISNDYGTPSNMEETEDEEDENGSSETGDGAERSSTSESSDPHVRAQDLDVKNTTDDDAETDWTVKVLLDNRSSVELSLDTPSILQGSDFFDLEDPDDEDVEDHGGYSRVSTTMQICGTNHLAESTAGSLVYSRISSLGESWEL